MDWVSFFWGAAAVIAAEVIVVVAIFAFLHFGGRFMGGQ